MCKQGIQLSLFSQLSIYSSVHKDCRSRAAPALEFSLCISWGCAWAGTQVWISEAPSDPGRGHLKSQVGAGR